MYWNSSVLLDAVCGDHLEEKSGTKMEKYNPEVCERFSPFA